jgi:hypothetical protein
MTAFGIIESLRRALNSGVGGAPGPVSDTHVSGVVPSSAAERIERLNASAETHSDISAAVYHRLLLRAAVLGELETVEQKRLSNLAPSPEVASKLTRFEVEKVKAEKERGYNLAVTDLFVEKALAYLEADAERYQKKGYRLYRYARISVLIGVVLSVIGTHPHAINALLGKDLFKSIASEILGANANGNGVWIMLISNFTTSFTMYGFLVLFSVANWRYGRAFLDQAERLLERRHALRQGRLFIHLSKEALTVEDLDKAFNWNVSTHNAFANMQTEASAPWGSVLAELAKTIPKIVEATATGLQRADAKSKQQPT